MGGFGGGHMGGFAGGHMGGFRGNRFAGVRGDHFGGRRRFGGGYYGYGYGLDCPYYSSFNWPYTCTY